MVCGSNSPPTQSWAGLGKGEGRVLRTSEIPEQLGKTEVKGFGDGESRTIQLTMQTMRTCFVVTLGPGGR